MNKSHVRLFKLLAQLFPDSDSSTVLIDEAGIDKARIYAEQSAGTKFYFVVREAEKAGKVARLLDVALTRFPHHAELKQLRSEFLQEGCTQ